MTNRSEILKRCREIVPSIDTPESGLDAWGKFEVLRDFLHDTIIPWITDLEGVPDGNS
jgi:hypothetical protein